MNVENFQKLVLSFKSHKPFKIFTIQLHNGERFEVDHPDALAFRDGLVALISNGNIPVWFDHESVSDVTDAPAQFGDTYDA